MRTLNTRVPGGPLAEEQTYMPIRVNKSIERNKKYSMNPRNNVFVLLLYKETIKDLKNYRPISLTSYKTSEIILDLQYPANTICH